MASASLRNVLADIGKLFAPAPPFSTVEYDGLEYRWKSLIFRPALFKKEAILLLGVLFYVVFYYIGKTRNRRRAEAWMTAHLPILSQQFSCPQVAPIIEGASKPINGLIADGCADFFVFSTGRRHVASMHTVFSFLPRHDLAQIIYNFAWSFFDLVRRTEDTVELDFTLLPSLTPSFVWGVVSKDYLCAIKDGRWDLTFTRMTESPLLGGGYCVMSEYADVTEALLKTGPYSIANALNDPVSRPYIKSLTITDQPRSRPTMPPPSELRTRHLILTLRVPPVSHASETLPIVRAVFALIDALEFSPPSYASAVSAFQREMSITATSLTFGTGYTLRPETRSKLLRTREDFYAQLLREQTADSKEKLDADKLAAKRRAEEERVARMSSDDQSKHLERERRKQIRKAQGKVARK